VTDSLKEMTCIPCRGDEPTATQEEIEAYSKQVPDWEIVEVEGVKRLRRTFKLKNFEQALAFTNRIGAIAEEQDHHPVIELTWGRVTVSWWTHAINGLHQNDFIMAAKTDEVFRQE